MDISEPLLGNESEFFSSFFQRPKKETAEPPRVGGRSRPVSGRGRFPQVPRASCLLRGERHGGDTPPLRVKRASCLLRGERHGGDTPPLRVKRASCLLRGERHGGDTPPLRLKRASCPLRRLSLTATPSPRARARGYRQSGPRPSGSHRSPQSPMPPFPAAPLTGPSASGMFMAWEDAHKGRRRGAISGQRPAASDQQSPIRRNRPALPGLSPFGRPHAPSPSSDARRTSRPQAQRQAELSIASPGISPKKPKTG